MDRDTTVKLWKMLSTQHELFMALVEMVRASVHNLNKFKGLSARTKCSNVENVKLLIHRRP